MRHLIEEQLILYYYGESANDAAIESHLALCDSCRSEFQELKRVLAMVDTLPVPERGREYGGEVWRRLHPLLHKRGRFGWATFFAPSRLAAAGAMAAVLLAAFFLGRYWPRPEKQVAEQPAAEQIRERVFLGSVVDHLERSQMVLMEFSNAQSDGEIDISTDKAWARELLEENRIFRLSAVRNAEVGLASVLDELERILLEISNSPTRLSKVERGEIRRRIEDQGILFKLRVMDSSVRRRQNEAARELARRSS